LNHINTDLLSQTGPVEALCRRDHLRALAQRVEVDTKEVRIMGSKSELLRTLVAASSAKTAGFGVPSFVPIVARPEGFELPSKFASHLADAA
jgi:hypothetical protein